MNRLFFFGTLCHRELLELVAGRKIDPHEMKPARLPGYQVSWAKGQIFPMIMAKADVTAEGVLFTATSEETARMNFYEGGFNYDLEHVLCEGETETAEVYLPQPGAWQTGVSWSLETFIREHGDHNLRTAAAFMNLYGKVSRDEAMKRLPLIRAVTAKASKVGEYAPVNARTGLGSADVELQSYHRPFDGFFAMEKLRLRHRRFDGGMTATMEREVLSSVDATIVLPYDPVLDRVLLVEQFRSGAFVRGDPHPWMLEPVAGRIDVGETAEAAARREAVEETGVALTELIPVNGHYPSPGYSSEFYHCFLGICDLPDGTAGLGGVEDEHEDIRSHLLSFDALMQLLDSGEAQVGPLVMLALWLARHRDRLRRGFADTET